VPFIFKSIFKFIKYIPEFISKVFDWTYLKWIYLKKYITKIHLIKSIRRKIRFLRSPDDKRRKKKRSSHNNINKNDILNNRAQLPVAVNTSAENCNYMPIHIKKSNHKYTKIKSFKSFEIAMNYMGGKIENQIYAYR